MSFKIIDLNYAARGGPRTLASGRTLLPCQDVRFSCSVRVEYLNPNYKYSINISRKAKNPEDPGFVYVGDHQ